MEVFSTVVAEISASVYALLPENENSNYERHRKIQSHTDDRTQGCPLEHFDREGAELTINHKAQFLEEKFKDLNVSVVVMTECLSDTVSSLKLCGRWSEICTVRFWLMQFIQTAGHTLTVNDTEQLETGARHEAALTEHCTELSSNKPRRSLRNRHTAKQDHDAKAILLSTLASSKRIRAKQLKQNSVQAKKSKVLSTNVTKNISGNSDTTEEMFESFADCNVTKNGAHVDDILTPAMVLTGEQFATEISVMESGGSSSIRTSLVGAAGRISEVCSELGQQLKKPVKINESEQNSSLRELKCDSCDYVTEKRRNLLMHVARTHGERSYICPTCSRTFAVAKDLNQHLKCHTEQYCCEHCGRTLKSKYAVALHVARIHKGLAPRPLKRYLCTLCGKMCRNKTDYNVHRNKEHTGVRPFPCDVCNTSFFSRSSLRAHHQVLEFCIV